MAQGTQRPQSSESLWSPKSLKEPQWSDCDCGRAFEPRGFEAISREIRFMASYMSRDSDRLVFRKFEKLQIYNLLYLQHQLAHITETLENVIPVRNSIDEQKFDRLLSRLDPLLKEYNKSVNIFKATKASPEVPKYVVESLKKLKLLKSWSAFENEYSIGQGWDDLAPIVAQEKGAIHRYVDSKPGLSHQFGKFAGENPKSLLYTYSEHAVRVVEQAIIGIIILALVGAPVIIFARVPSLYGTILVTLGFIILAIPILGSLLKKSDIPYVGLVFGYAAVLVAFTSQKQ